MSICPKNKSSKGRRDKRRANWKMSPVNLVKCSKCGALMMPHRVCKACGSYSFSGVFRRLSENAACHPKFLGILKKWQNGEKLRIS